MSTTLYFFAPSQHSREPKGWWPLGSGTFWNLPHTTQNTANMSMYVQYWQSQGFCTIPNRREGVCCVAIHSLIISQRQYSTKFKIQFGAPHRTATVHNDLTNCTRKLNLFFGQIRNSTLISAIAINHSDPIVWSFLSSVVTFLFPVFLRDQSMETE